MATKNPVIGIPRHEFIVLLSNIMQNRKDVRKAVADARRHTKVSGKITERAESYNVSREAIIDGYGIRSAVDIQYLKDVIRGTKLLSRLESIAADYDLTGAERNDFIQKGTHYIEACTKQQDSPSATLTEVKVSGSKEKYKPALLNALEPMLQGKWYDKTTRRITTEAPKNSTPGNKNSDIIPLKITTIQDKFSFKGFFDQLREKRVSSENQAQFERLLGILTVSDDEKKKLTDAFAEDIAASIPNRRISARS